MILVGIEFLLSQIAHPSFAAKMLLIQKGAIFFPTKEQHRNQKAPGISYADESARNALAAMFSPGKIEIRNHREFSEERVAVIVASLLSHGVLSPLKTWQVLYRGKNLNG